jgi:hypothetical protein
MMQISNNPICGPFFKALYDDSKPGDKLYVDFYKHLVWPNLYFYIKQAPQSWEKRLLPFDMIISLCDVPRPSGSTGLAEVLGMIPTSSAKHKVEFSLYRYG